MVPVAVTLRWLGKLVLALNLLLMAVSNLKYWKASHNSSADRNSSLEPQPLAVPTNISATNFLPRCFLSLQDLAAKLDQQRWSYFIHCHQHESLVTRQKVDLNQTVPGLNWAQDQPCVQDFVRRHCYSRPDQLVPNLVHYVWFGHVLFKAENLISVLSAVRFQQPCAIIFHTRDPPYGPVWTLLLSLVPNIFLARREEPLDVFGKKFRFIQHKADIVRLEVLNATGGIYLDNDQLLVRPVQDLMNQSLVMSHENKNNLANSMILAQPGAPFLQLWYREYRWYNPKVWGYHSTYVPWILAKKHSSLIRVVDNLFVNPDLTDILKVFHGHYNLSGNYGLHLYTRFHPKIQLNLPQVCSWNSSLGEVWRFILYNSPDLFKCSQLET